MAMRRGISTTPAAAGWRLMGNWCGGRGNNVRDTVYDRL
jgi:hypothetical protein